MNKVIDVWKKNLFDKNADVDVDNVSLTVDDLLECIEREGIETIDLSSVKSKDVNSEHLACILRMTFKMNDQVRGWHHALAVCYETAVIDKKDPDDLLFGFFPKKLKS